MHCDESQQNSTKQAENFLQIILNIIIFPYRPCWV